MKEAAALRIRFWGVRGSYPTPGPSTVEVGGNSSCVEIDDRRARRWCSMPAPASSGSGASSCERPGEPDRAHLPQSPAPRPHRRPALLRAAVQPGVELLRVRRQAAGPRTLKTLLTQTMSPRFFPVSLSQLPARVSHPQPRASRSASRFGRQRSRRDVQARYSRAHPKIGRHALPGHPRRPLGGVRHRCRVAEGRFRRRRRLRARRRRADPRRPVHRRGVLTAVT